MSQVLTDTGMSAARHMINSDNKTIDTVSVYREVKKNVDRNVHRDQIRWHNYLLVLQSA